MKARRDNIQQGKPADWGIISLVGAGFLAVLLHGSYMYKNGKWPIQRGVKPAWCNSPDSQEEQEPHEKQRSNKPIDIPLPAAAQALLDNRQKPAPPDSGFIWASTFQGPKGGMVFKKGEYGVGYYPDNKL